MAVSRQSSPPHGASVPAGPGGSRGAAAAKFAIPAPPPHHLRRPRLEARIREGATDRLVLVTAPAGHGKTTAVADAFREAPEVVAWVSLDDSDRHPPRALRSLLTSLEHATGLPLVPPGPADADPVGTLLAAVHGLEALDDEVTLVVDEADDVLHGETAHLLRLLLEWLPTTLHAVVVSRRQPVIGLERRRARDEVTVVGSADLAFTVAEVEAYLEGPLGLPLDRAEVRRLWATTEGWPAALHLLSIPLTREHGRADALHGVGPGEQGIARYLVSEVIDGLSPEDRRFLLDTSVLGDLVPELCDAVTERDDGAVTLARLGAQGLLLPVGDDGRRWRHHRLLRDLLREQLRGRDPHREVGLHSLASAWLAAHGDLAGAIEHALDAGEHPQALEWLEAAFVDLAAIDDGGRLRRTLARLPASAVASRPGLVAPVLDLAMLAGDRDTLEELLDAVEDAWPVTGPPPWPARSARAYLGRLRGDGVEQIEAEQGGRRPDPITAHPLAVALGVDGRHDAAARAFRHALMSADPSREPIRRLVVLGDFAWERAAAGHLVDADSLSRRATNLASRLALPVPPTVTLARAQIALDRGRPDLARQEALEVRRWALQGDDLLVRAEASALLGRVLVGRGDVVGAVRTLESLREDLEDRAAGGALYARLARAQAGVHLADDDVEGAGALTPGVDDELAALPPEDRLLSAYLALRRGDAGRARRLAAGVQATGAGPRLTVQALRTLAAAVGMLGDPVGSRHLRHEAERAARTAGLLPVTRRPSAPSTALPPVDREVVAAAEATRTPTRTVPQALTERELRVLDRLPMASNTEIAGDLLISVNTVKSHLKSVYRKLGVGSRDAAVRKARLLGLV